jgi:plastocyanin
MNRPIVALLAGSALVLAGGCGSSGSSSSASTAPVAESSSGVATANTTSQYPSPSASSPVQSGIVQVAYRNIAISPDALRVKVGSTIRWTNFDSVEHNVTSQGGAQQFASKDFGENGTFEVKAAKPGVIKYQCTLHPASMNGTIEVVK